MRWAERVPRVRFRAIPVCVPLGLRFRRERGCLIGSCALRCAAPERGPQSLRSESFVLDIVYVLGVIALFVIVGLVGKAVEKL